MHYLRLPFSIVAFTMLTLFVCRFVLLFSYPEYFGSLSFAEAAAAFLSGLRFDMSVSVMGLSLFLLLFLIPVRFIHNRLVLVALSTLSLLITLFLIVLTLADVSYFSEVYRHLGAEVTRLGDDFGAVADVAFGSRLHQTLLSGLFILFVVYVWSRVILKPLLHYGVSLKQVFWKRGLVSFVALIVLLLMGRGLVLQGKPLDIVDAFSAGDQVSANLALNGAFVVFKEASAADKKQIRYFDEKEFSRISEQVGSGSPFMIQTQPLQTKKNVVFILLESWSYKYIDGLAGNDYGVTPFMDDLVSKSVVWDNFYAAGQRSILGIQAVLSSVPVLENQPVLGFGLELHNLSRLAEEANQKGFRTLMVQSSNRRSFHMDGIAKSLGFSEYYGKEDMPVLRDYPQGIPRFGWDYETLMFTKSQIDRGYSESQPFFSFVFTGTTHEPFADPGEEFHVYTHSDADESGFLNTLRYADWSIEQFMTAAEQQPWYDDTVFVFSADHVLRANTKDLAEKFRIPLIIYSPDGSLKPERRLEVASQYNLMPSLLELMGVETQVSSFGESLWAKRRGGAYVSQGSVAGYINDDLAVSFTQKELLGQSDLTEAESKEIDQLKWSLQYADSLLMKNKWAPMQREGVQVVSQ